MMQTPPQKMFFQRLTVLFIGLFSSLLTSQINAADEQQIFNTQIYLGSDGLGIQQPSISQTEILKTLSQAHLLLTQQGDDAQKTITENSVTGNIAMAAIIPGGLIYLAYKQSKISNAEAILTGIKNELLSLDRDAVTLYQVVVARYP